MTWARSPSPRILLKTGAFASEEREIMQEHTSLGAELLSGGKSRIVQVAEQIAMCDHERWDGRGYPEGLSGLEIPVAARIVGAAQPRGGSLPSRPV
jgi:putative two-component system response regulator